MNLIYIDKIPDDLIEYYIWPYISIYIKIWLNKKYYLKYHKYIIDYIREKDNYIKDIIQHDYYFVFTQLIIENLDDWLNPRDQIFFNNILFKDNLNYINYLINKYNSEKCNNILLERLKYSRLQKKWHKNNISKNIRWIK